MACEICGNETKKGKKSCSKECSYKLRAMTRRTTHDSIEKLCEICQNPFQDTTKKKLASKCKVCAYRLGVQLRMERGNYARSDVQNEKLSASLRARHDAGIHFTEDGLKRLSSSLTTKWKTSEFREKVKQGYVRNSGFEHHMKSDSSRAAASVRGRNYKISDDARRSMRQAAAKRLREGRNNTQFYGVGGFREDLKLYVRSRWEANFARFLRFTGQEFEYEPMSFTLSCGKTYTPDFKVGDTYYEVKGWWSPVARQKFDDFCSEYPNVKLKIIGPDEYNRLRKSFSMVIESWE